MNNKDRILRAIKQPRYLVAFFVRRCARWIGSDRFYVKTIYRLYTGKRLDLVYPQTYNEKLNWQKLYDHNPLYTKMVDKYAAKEYVANIIGKEYIIPTLGCWETPEEISWDSLPEKFVLKTTHDSGGVVIVKDKRSLNKRKALKILSQHLKADNFSFTREWPYKNVPRRIIAEQYVEDKKTHELRDYKFFCFNGQVKALFVAQDRGKSGEEVKFDYFDSDFNHLDIHQYHAAGKEIPEKPVQFDEMKQLASRLEKTVQVDPI